MVLRSEAGGDLLDSLGSFARSPLDEHDFAASLALQALDFRKSVRLLKACP